MPYRNAACIHILKVVFWQRRSNYEKKSTSASTFCISWSPALPKIAGGKVKMEILRSASTVGQRTDIVLRPGCYRPIHLCRSGGWRADLFFIEKKFQKFGNGKYFYVSTLFQRQQVLVTAHNIDATSINSARNELVVVRIGDRPQSCSSPE